MPSKSPSLNSRRKGAAGELAAAKLLTAAGHPARRGRQYAGHPDAPDIVCPSLPIHWEVKVVEKLNFWNALDQARKDCPPEKTPIVLAKKRRTGWVVTLGAEDFLRMLARMGSDR